MDIVKILEYHQEETAQNRNYSKIIKFALFEASILIMSLVLLSFIFTKLNSVALPVSLENGRVISFEAVQNFKLRELFWPVVIITLNFTVISAYLYAKLFAPEK